MEHCGTVIARGKIELLEEAHLSRYDGVSKNFQTGLLEPELQMVQRSATRCSYIAIS